MVVIKSQKLSRLHPSGFLDKSTCGQSLRRKKGRRKLRGKKIFLKAAARNLTVLPSDNSSGSKKKKIVCVKKRCYVRKDRKQRTLSSTVQDSKDRVTSWLNHQAVKNIEQSSERAPTTSINFLGTDMETNPPIKENAEINVIFQPLATSNVSSQQSNVNNSKCNVVMEVGVSSSKENVLESSLVNGKCHREEQPSILTSGGLKVTSSPKSLECDDVDNVLTENFSTKSERKSKLSRRPLRPAKRLKASVGSQRKAFQRYYLKNSHGGFHLALKKFRREMHTTAPNELPSILVDPPSINKVPMKISARKRLDPLPSFISVPSTPDHNRSVTNFVVSPLGLHPRSVVSCKLPFDTSVDSGLSEDGTNSPEESTGNHNQVKEKRDVCYVFALLDRERSETLFKCSPHLKSSEILEQLSSVIQTISMDDDLMTTGKTPSHRSLQKNNSHTVNRCVDRSTSPILSDNPSKAGGACIESTDDWEVNSSNISPGAEDHLGSTKVKVEGQEKTKVTAATRVMIVKALTTLTSELKIPTDISLRLLQWTSEKLRGDLDTDLCEDTFEGFLCHCHDKISIFLECCFILDSKFIINLDEIELRNMWLLHDALCCMLQAYRYIQDLSSSAPSTLSQHLLSLMTTCAKTILPNEKVSITMWTSLMTMIQGINEKLCQKDVLSKACECHKHFISLSQNRFCRVCDLNCLYEDVCRDTENDVLTSTKKEKAELITSFPTVVDQLFPRYSWFLSRIENLSEEEFKTAYSKHLVMKFACNSQSGLLPCNEHVSEVACICFSKLGFDSQAEIDEAATSSNIIANQEKSGSYSTNDTDIDHKKQSTADVTSGVTSDTCENNDIQSSSESIQSVIPPSDRGSSEGLRSNKEGLPENSFIGEKMSGEGSIQSDDFTLELVPSPGEITSDTSNLKRQNRFHGNEKAPKLDNINSVKECSENDEEVVEQEDSDETLENKSPDVDYLPLNFQLAQSALESAHSSFDSHTSSKGKDEAKHRKSNILNQALSDSSNQNFKNKCKMSVEEITLDSDNSSDISECMRNVSFGEDSVFVSSPSQERGSENDSGSVASSVNTEKNSVSKISTTSLKTLGAPLTDAYESTSLQSSLSSDSLQMQNGGISNDKEISSNSIDIKPKSNAAYGVEKQKRLVSPPLYHLCQSSESETSGSYYDPYPKYNKEMKSLNNSMVQVIIDDEQDHRTRSGRDFRSKKLMPPPSYVRNYVSFQRQDVSSDDSRSTQEVLNLEVKRPRRDSERKKDVTQSRTDEVEVPAAEQVAHSVEAQRSAPRVTNPQHLTRSNSKCRDVKSVNFDTEVCTYKERTSKASEKVSLSSGQAKSTLKTSTISQQEDLDLHDNDLTNDVEDLSVEFPRETSVTKKLSKLARGNGGGEDLGPSESMENFQAWRSSSKRKPTSSFYSKDTSDKVARTAKSKQESFHTYESEDDGTGTVQHNAEEMEVYKQSCKEIGTNIEKNLQLAGKHYEKNIKYSMFNDSECNSALQGHNLTSILKIGSTMRKEPEVPAKRNISETDLEVSANNNKRVRFSSPNNSYYFIETRKEYQKTQNQSQSAKRVRNVVNDEISSVPSQSISEDKCVITDKAEDKLNNPFSSEHEEKPVRRRKNCSMIVKSDPAVSSTEDNAAFRESNAQKRELGRSRSDPQTANRKKTVPISSLTNPKNRLIHEKNSDAELPAKIKVGRSHSKTNKAESSQIPDSRFVEEHFEKPNKKKQLKKTEKEEFFNKPLPTGTKEIAETLESARQMQKSKRLRKGKKMTDSSSAPAATPVDQSGYNTYLSMLRERV